MRRLANSLCGIVILVVCCALCTTAQTDSARLPLKERVRVAAEIYSSVNTYFAHWRGVPGFDLEKEFGAYLDQILATDDRRSFDLASMEFIAKLHNGHSGFGDKWLRETYGQQLGFYAYPIDGAWVVARSSLPDLKPGDVITHIGDEKFEDFFHDLRKYVSASDERWQQRAFFEYPYLFPASFSLTLEGGRKVSVTRRGEFQWPGEEHNSVSASEQDNVTYIRVPAFQPPEIEKAAVRALGNFTDAKAIIVDVRGNHGGSTPSELTAKLMDRPYRWFAESTPASIGLFNYSGQLAAHSELHWYGEVEQPDKAPYRGSVYILADGGCFSACEDFVEPFKDNHRATIVGERTAGSSGQPYSKDLGDGMRIGLSTKREFMPDGAEFEGVGIAPDVEVKMTADDLRRGNDPALERARLLIREQLNK